jgi:PAS domain S-box-containing protein
LKGIEALFHWLDRGKEKLRFRAVFDASFDAYFLIDPRGRAFDCNSRAIALFHLSGRDEALTLGPLCFLPETQPDGRRSYDAFLALIAEAMAEGYARREWRFRVRGSEMPAELTIIRLDVAPPPVLLVVVHDLTEHKKAEAQLVESRNLLRGVIDNSLAVICAKDLDGRYLLVNRRWGEILDLTEEEVVGRTDAEIFPPDQALDYRRNDLQVLQTRQPLTIEEHAVIDGERRTFLAVKFPIIDRDGQARAVCGISTDITELKRIQAELHEARQQADAANRAKTQFLANMSHEIRTPMNAILGFAYLALQADPPPRLADYLQKIQSAAKGLLGIINEILDFSKIEVGKLTLERIEFDLERVLDNVAGMITLRAQEKGLELVLAVEPNVPRRLLGDPLRLEQVLVNLTSNAVKFTERGEVIVAVRALPAPAPAAAPLPGATASPAAASRRPEQAAAAKEPAADETPAPPSAEADRQAPRPTPEPATDPALEPARVILEFQVRDTGVGLTPDQISRLFQPFTQADGSTTRKYGGTGLGLSICKRLVEMMHGTIGVSSEPGRGSTFTFTAEVGLADAAPAVVPAALPDLRHLSVLVVDDHPASREYLSHVLRSLSFEVVEARDGQEALAILDRRPADRPIELILMDWQMPGLDGIETARRIHGRLGARPAPPPPTIIMVTAFSRDRVMAHAGDAPIDEFLVKPVTPSTLFDAILRVFKQEHPQRRPTAPPPDLPGPDLRRLAGRRVLLVEDNDLNQEVAVSLLTKAGLVVETATNGREALQRLEAGAYELVLMDCQMPEMDGYECTAAIRRQARWARLPIIAMTANAVAGDRDRCLQVGMNDHVAKPIDPATLFGVLARWLPTEEGSPDRGGSPQSAPALAASTGPSPASAAAPASATALATTAGPLPPTSPSPSREPASVASHPSIVVPAPASTGEAPAPAGPAARAARAAPEPNARTESAPRPTTAPSPSSATPLVAQLERLPGIDLPAALARLGGDAVLLRNLLRKFRSRHLDFGDLVMRAIDQGKWDEARRLAHTLKGVAATVGARGLPDLAAELETILAEHRRAEVTPALMAVQAALLALCAQIDDLPDEPGSSPPAGGRRAAATVQPLLDRLMKSLQADDAEAITHFGHLRDALTAWPEVGPDVQALARAIEAYTFDEAIPRLEALAKRLATL